uniref:PROP1-like PPR domain-containing protein n=1 Tax=Salix viminalis TaxID=40686 RepID=A0A6N2KM93_SALVM
MKIIILESPFLPPPPNFKPKPKPKSINPDKIPIKSSIHPDPWSLSDGNNISKPKPKSRNPKNPLSDDNARRIIIAKARYLSLLRKHQGPQAQTPKWIKRTPEQMVQYLEDDRNGHLYGKHVGAAIKRVRGLAGKKNEERDMRLLMSGFVGKLSFREMCVVLKEQKGWREARDFFSWMKLQLSYHPSVIVYTILLRLYGQVGKIKLAEQTFLEMLEVGCEPDEVACGTMLCSYARWGHHRAMFSFYSAIKERGIVVSIAVYNFMLSSLQKKSLHGKVIVLWMQMVEKRVAPNNFTYTVVISSLVKEGLREEAFKTFNEMRTIGLVPEEVIYSLLITTSTKNSNWHEATRLYEDMRSHRIVPSKFTCASLLTMYYKTKDYSKALSLFTQMQSKKIAADEVIYGLLIRIFGKLGLYEDAQKTFEETEQSGLLSNEKTYLAMAQVHLSSGNFEKALSVIEVMKSRNIWLSRFAYIVLLQCYCMKEDLDSAEATFQALSKIGCPDAGSCSDMINLYVRLGLTEKAKDFIVQIRKGQLDFDDELFNTVIKVFCKEGMLKDAEQLVYEMGTNASFKDNRFFKTFSKVMYGENKELENIMVFADTMALGLILSLYLENGNFTKTEEFLKLILEAGSGLSMVSQLVNNFIREGDLFKAEAVNGHLIKLGSRLEDETIASLISVYGRQNKLKQAQEVYAAVADSPILRNPIINSMIDACVKCGKFEEAYLLYKEAVQRGHNLDAVGIGMVVNALTNSGKHPEAENIICRSIQDRMELDTVAYNIFIKAMLEAGRLHFAASIYEHMLSLGFTPSIQTYNTMISVYGRGRKLDKAVEVFNMACSMGVSLDEKAYMNMINYYGKAGKRHEASLLFAKMQEEGIKPGVVSYNIMVKVYAMSGLYHEVEDLFKAMVRDGCPPDSSTYLSLVQAYSESSKCLEAEETINAMRKKGIPPSCAHFKHLLYALVKAGLMIEAERVYMELLSAGLNPDLLCCRAMLRGYMDYGHVEKGIKYFEQIRESVKADRFIMSAAVHLYKSAGKKLEAEAVFESMKNLRISFLDELEVGLKIQRPSHVSRATDQGTI